MPAFNRDALRLKIDSLSAESRLLRARELGCLDRATNKEFVSLGRFKGLKVGDKLPEAVTQEIEKRTKPIAERAKAQAGNSGLMLLSEAQAMGQSIARAADKVIRKHIRAGLTKEEILALPGMTYALRERNRAASYRTHRIGPVRRESRHAQLALAFLRGREYRHTEDRARTPPNWDEIQRIATKFSSEDKRIIAQRLECWAQEARDVIKGRQIALKNAQGNTLH